MVVDQTSSLVDNADQDVNPIIPQPIPAQERFRLLQLTRTIFNLRRRIEIQGIPPRISKEDIGKILLKGWEYLEIYRGQDDRVHILFTTPEQAYEAVTQFNGELFDNKQMFVCFSQSTFLLFVGNIPYNYNIEQFREMMLPYGKIERIFLVHSDFTGQSKGYGFVEYLKKADADRAKHEFSQELQGRKLRIDYANYGLFEYDHIHSTTLFIDKFAPETTSEDLRKLFVFESKILFCEIATNPVNKKKRNFALLDFPAAENAEKIWAKLNGALLHGSPIRIVFSAPARTGAAIIGGQPNILPQLMNVPIPPSIPKITVHIGRKKPPVRTPFAPTLPDASTITKDFLNIVTTPPPDPNKPLAQNGTPFPPFSIFDKAPFAMNSQMVPPPWHRFEIPPPFFNNQQDFRQLFPVGPGSEFRPGHFPPPNHFPLPNFNMPPVHSMQRFKKLTKSEKVTDIRERNKLKSGKPETLPTPPEESTSSATTSQPAESNFTPNMCSFSMFGAIQAAQGLKRSGEISSNSTDANVKRMKTEWDGNYANQNQQNKINQNQQYNESWYQPWNGQADYTSSYQWNATAQSNNAWGASQNNSQQWTNTQQWNSASSANDTSNKSYQYQIWNNNKGESNTAAGSGQTTYAQTNNNDNSKANQSNAWNASSSTSWNASTTSSQWGSSHHSQHNLPKPPQPLPDNNKQWGSLQLQTTPSQDLKSDISTTSGDKYPQTASSQTTNEWSATDNCWNQQGTDKQLSWSQSGSNSVSTKPTSYAQNVTAAASYPPLSETSAQISTLQANQTYSQPFVAAAGTITNASQQVLSTAAEPAASILSNTAQQTYSSVSQPIAAQQSASTQQSYYTDQTTASLQQQPTVLQQQQQYATQAATTSSAIIASQADAMAQANLAAQQYIQYYQQWYASQMCNSPGFDMASTMSQVAMYATQYYQQYYSQQLAASTSQAAATVPAAATEAAPPPPPTQVNMPLQQTAVASQIQAQSYQGYYVANSAVLDQSATVIAANTAYPTATTWTYTQQQPQTYETQTWQQQPVTTAWNTSLSSGQVNVGTVVGGIPATVEMIAKPVTYTKVL